MSALRTLQQQMLQAVQAQTAPPLQIICNDDIADAKARLAVYQHGYRVRLRDVLKQEFSGLRCMVGRQFERLLDRYIAMHPSSHYNIRWYGADVGRFLDAAYREKPQLAAAARLDWAISTAFDAADEPSIDSAQLAAVAPADWTRLRLSLQQNVQVLDGHYNVDVFRKAADQGARRPRLRRSAKPRQILVWRYAMTVHYRVLGEDEAQVLEAAQRGESFPVLCTILASHCGDSAVPRMAVLLQTWVASGLIREIKT